MKSSPSRRRRTAPPQDLARSGSERVPRAALLILSVLLILLSIYIRYVTRAMTNTDMTAHILPWYEKLQTRGPLIGLGQDFYNYTPPYLYLLALATLTSKIISPITSVKLIAMLFDVFAAIMIFKIVRLQRASVHISLLAASLFFCGPTMLANSAIWGQADSTYTAFLLTCLYFLLIQRPLPAVLCFGVALALKPQGIFFAPLLLLFMLWGRIRWYHFLAAPIVYGLCMAPAVYLGRTWEEVWTVYTRQAGAGKALTHNAATVYVFISREAYTWLLWPAAFIAIAVFIGWVYCSWRSTRRQDLPAIVLLALVCVTLVPFLLPNMRERYFYPADTISLVLAFVWPALWYVPILFQVISLLSYSMFLWNGTAENLQAAALVCGLTLILLLRQQGSLALPSRSTSPEHHPSPVHSPSRK